MMFKGRVRVSSNGEPVRTIKVEVPGSGRVSMMSIEQAKQLWIDLQSAIVEDRAGRDYKNH